MPAQPPPHPFATGEPGGPLELDSRPPPSRAPFATQETQSQALTDALAAEHALDDEGLARLEAARLNQAKMGRILAAVTELLREKGITR